MGIIYSVSSGLNDSIFGLSQEPIKALLTENVEAFEKKSLIDKIFYMDTSKNAMEKYTEEAVSGGFQDVGENGAYPLSSMQEGYSKVIEPCEWKNSFSVTQTAIEDAKMGRIKSKTFNFAKDYGRTRENFAATLLAGGLSSKTTFNGKFYDTTSADGKPLFSTEHSSVFDKKRLQSNKFKGTLSVSVFDTVQEKMQDLTDHDGNLLAIMPDTIIIPNNAVLKRKIFEIVGSDLDPDTSNNAINFQFGLWNVLIWAYLPKTVGDKPYFMMADSNYLKGNMCLPFIDRVKLSVNSDIDPNTGANIFRGRARFGAGFNDYKGIAICGEGVTAGTAIV